MNETKYEKLPPDFKAKWIAALRSGEYLKTTSELVGMCANQTAYCCLGVACRVVGLTDEQLRGFGEIETCLIEQGAPIVRGAIQHVLIDMNDGSGEDGEPKSFAEIADWIEANL